MTTDSPIKKSSGDMDVESFRKSGYEIIDYLCDYFTNIEQNPVLSQVKPGEIKDKFEKTPPKDGTNISGIFQEFKNKITPGLTHWNHPYFHAYFAITASMPGILGELLTAGLNQQGMLWKTSPALTEHEEVTLNWLRQMLGLPEDFFGIIYDYASVSTMHAICAAREALNINVRDEGLSEAGKLRLYCSTETHSSVDKGAIVAGIGLKNVVKIETNDKFQLDVNALEEAIKKDKEAGYIPFCVVGTIGTTSSTSVDPIPEIAEVCKKYNLWFHVDGAYGGPVGIIPEERHILNGVAEADSFVLNAHKWLFTPLDCSILYCKKPEVLKRAFSLVPEYLKTEKSKVNNLMDYGIQLGRRFRSLKLWMIMKYFGHEGLAARLKEHLRLAKLFGKFVEDDSSFELVAPISLANVCFRFNPGLNDEEKLAGLNEALMNSLNKSGKLFLSHTVLKGKYTLRFAVGNIRTTEKHIEKAWDVIKQVSKTLV